MFRYKIYDLITRELVGETNTEDQALDLAEVYYIIQKREAYIIDTKFKTTDELVKL